MPDIGTLQSVQQGSINIVSVAAGVVRPVAVDIATVEFQGEEYTGETTFTPSSETQTIQIKGRVATEDITIEPIPQNYGLITWNGAFLTVS